MIPDKIYIHRKDNPLEITWSEIKEKNATNIEYIRKDALMEWVREKMNINLTEADNTDDRFTRGIAAGFGSVVDKLKSM